MTTAASGPVGSVQTSVRLVAPPAGRLSPLDFDTVSTPLATLPAGGFVVRNTWLSVDASVALRIAGGGGGYLPPVEAGALVDGWAVGRVVASRSTRFAVGSRVLHHAGWRDRAVLDDTASGWGAPTLLSEDGLPDESYLGALGPTGLTAWAGLLRVAELADGDVVMVSAAAGAVGCLVVQLAVARGHRVVATAGSPAKLELLHRLGAAVTVDHRAGPIGEQLAAAVPDGVDVYFDNVGGDHLEAALDLLRPGGRVALCGAVSGYGPDGPAAGPRNLFQATVKGLTLRGFLAREFAAELVACQAELRPELSAGRLVLPTHVVDGLDQTPQALVDLLAGRNTGKVLVRL